jgi:membrane protein implicated in regulation of membrane protease activity
MKAEARAASIAYGVAFAAAICAALVTVVVGLTFLLFGVAATLDGRWQAALALAAFSALAVMQAWLFWTAPKRRDAGRMSLGTLYLLISVLPALILIYVVTL